MAGTNLYNTVTGAKLSPGQSYTNAQGNTVTQGSTVTTAQSTPKSSSSSSSSGGGGSSSSTPTTNEFNTVTGAKLSPGQTYVNSAGQTVKQGTPLGTFQTATTAPITTPVKPVGLDNINKILNYGSADTTGSTQVKELQTYLNGLTPNNTADDIKVDGIFGPQTKTAVMAFQGANGLTTDGIVGPLTLAKLKLNATTNATDGRENTNTNVDGTTTTFNTGNPANDALLQELVNTIKKQQETGLAINPDLVWDQATLDKFLNSAKKQIHPFYAQQINAIKDDVLKAAPQILQNYENDIAGSQADFTKNLGNARENYADTGLAFSGQRTSGELGIQASTNRDLASLNQTYGNKLYDLGRNAEQKIGADATPSLGSLANYSTNLSGNGGFNSTGYSTPYTSGGFQIGSLTNDEAAAVEARNLAIKKLAGEAVVAGRDYSSLFA